MAARSVVATLVAVVMVVVGAVEVAAAPAAPLATPARVEVVPATAPGALPTGLVSAPRVGAVSTTPPVSFDPIAPLQIANVTWLDNGIAPVGRTYAVSPADNALNVGTTPTLVGTSTEVVNAFALVDEDPVAAVDALEAAWDGFRERTADLDDGSRATVTAFDEALERLVDATRAAVADGQVDADALTAAAAEFEADARDAAALCEPEASPDA